MAIQIRVCPDIELGFDGAVPVRGRGGGEEAGEDGSGDQGADGARGGGFEFGVRIGGGRRWRGGRRRVVGEEGRVGEKSRPEGEEEAWEEGGRGEVGLEEMVDVSGFFLLGLAGCLVSRVGFFFFVRERGVCGVS